MTKLTKPVKRATDLPRGPVTVILEPGQIGFREKGRRKVFWLPLAKAYLMAVEASLPPRRPRRLRGTKLERGSR